ncbi:methylenetetrahydrofolate reductase [NAD(P)H] [Kiloniella laminariae]|uniref:Methylenetetrahydrofolate reductase n=1 Tax=Kiloniella laminariae TaxID=454162 RepID=A0ABT4LIJ1_9PROT|nr:methylenetetrahydrofolate reductase [NAD(P)H] [Kiloniella laminariae]MCZ4280930.1 methylenetetrahydrofolate reductase [NAD(P)H] [Kiloniella laminariae]
MKKTDISFELFPPATEAGLGSLYKTIERLKGFNPDYYSVTYGAGGSGQAKSKELLQELAGEKGLPIAAHITLAGASRQDILRMVSGWSELGIKRLVALRGDAAEPGQAFKAHPEGFADSIELVAALREFGSFEIAVAAYPEAHPDSRSLQADLDYLKRKQDAGASSAITQFFFEAGSFYRFEEAARAAGITIPLIPGILPINNIVQLHRFADRCGARIPAWVSKAFEGLEDDPETSAAVAVSLCLDLCRDLLAQGVDAFHFYTLNRPQLTEAVCRLLALQAETKEAA